MSSILFKGIILKGRVEMPKPIDSREDWTPRLLLPARSDRFPAVHACEPPFCSPFQRWPKKGKSPGHSDRGITVT
jgi:hypothetical protein